MCGIFAYLNCCTPKSRNEVVKILIDGLRRLSYRGYDSAGIAIDGCDKDNEQDRDILIFQKAGNVDILDQYILSNPLHLNMDFEYTTHCGIAHTRWATHGKPVDLNAHPQPSNDKNDFVVVHNGIITNYKELKGFLIKKGYKFISETDTEVIAKLIQLLYDRSSAAQGPILSFRQLVESTVSYLEGSYALVFKSRHFPGEMVATRHGSPMMIGIKSASTLATDNFPVLFSNEKAIRPLVSNFDDSSMFESTAGSSMFAFGSGHKYGSAHKYEAVHKRHSFIKHSTMLSTEPVQMNFDGEKTPTTPGARSIRPIHPEDKPAIEYFVASDACAIVEHTKQVVFLEDGDVAYINHDQLTIHRINGTVEGITTDQIRAIQTLTMEIQEIMKGEYSSFMKKEIFEQPESVVNTMRGRVIMPGARIVLGGIKDYMEDIQRCRRLILVACGTSYNSAVACRQLMEEQSELPVVVELASDFIDRETPIFRDDVCFFISQSGETADTLLALRYCKPHGALTIGITNTVGSSICRESHCGVHINAGPEIGVASTKAYTSQIIALVMIALSMSFDRLSKCERRLEICRELENIGEKIREVLTQLDDQVLEIAKNIHKEKSLLVMGRGYNFATCLEGALKIKELSYMHCEGILSGELKHGPLAMVDDKKCMVMIICKDNVYKKSLNALEQVLARGGRPIVIADRSVPDSDLVAIKDVLRVPKTVDCLQNLLTVIPLQMLSYHIAELNGLDVDRPRNLAKSVTVE